MNARPHRFLQYLQIITKNDLWHEVPAIDGGAAGKRRSCHTVAVEAPGRVLREIKSGIRIVIKWVTRALYISPLLIVIKLILGLFDQTLGDMMVVFFVLLVVCFFTLLNLYILWSVIVHVGSKGGPLVTLPFTSTGGDRREIFTRASELKVPGRDLVTLRGVVTPIDDFPIGSELVLRDLWATEGDAPWRLSEVMDFAVVAKGERPVIIRFNTAPIVIATPRKVTTCTGVDQMSAAANTVFDMAPALKGDRLSESALWLELSAGDEVEVMGYLHEEIPNVQRFELGGRLCSLESNRQQGHAPYRGVAGESGSMVLARPETPVWIQRV